MSASKTERLINLTILLLMSRRFVSRDKIRETVEDYRELSEQNFLRTFERDKDLLRSMGIPIETGSNDSFFEDEEGYRISRGDFELPPIEFTREEAMALGIAASVWQQASVAEPTAHALAKLRAAGVDPDSGRLGALLPQLNVHEQAFNPLWDAMLDRQAVRFGYRGGEQRMVQPWRLILRSNGGYLLGFDTGRDAPRIFKLSRIVGEVSRTGKPDAFVPPPAEKMNEQVTRLIPQPDLDVVLAIRADRAPALRRRGTKVSVSQVLPPGFEAYRLQLAGANAAAEIASYGPDLIVLEPADLRTEVLRQLEEVVRAHGDGFQEPTGV
ncbi:WYL domain-containing protein [Propionimicrobium sp. PCR01-08-3]|uniref:helix-turn-helix transcriptional regulator n=1 Tax=Propionimicrobium sp. PCR01-08-3 TaxID=3052086 RepID=UPI00255CC80F|nr:WYL domain-containing protein [Propionimicrobium sp. PCR01-08-3]WIY81483.1 WYL domain-containing protein [Propionimicrobium sp. PCR01-08-3]